jgi:hypothetical protein
MLLPFVAFVGGCVMFSVLGWVVLSALPGFRVSATNLLLFVVGAFAGASLSGLAYTHVFADAENELRSTGSVLGFFVALLVGTLTGGTAFVWLRGRLIGIIGRNHPR